MSILAICPQEILFCFEVYYDLMGRFYRIGNGIGLGSKSLCIVAIKVDQTLSQKDFERA